MRAFLVTICCPISKKISRRPLALWADFLMANMCGRCRETASARHWATHWRCAVKSAAIMQLSVASASSIAYWAAVSRQLFPLASSNFLYSIVLHHNERWPLGLWFQASTKMMRIKRPLYYRTTTLNPEQIKTINRQISTVAMLFDEPDDFQIYWVNKFVPITLTALYGIAIEYQRQKSVMPMLGRLLFSTVYGFTEGYNFTAIDCGNCKCRHWPRRVICCRDARGNC